MRNPFSDSFTEETIKSFLCEFDFFKILKSLGPIHFVKIRLSNFLGNEFLVKMYKL